MEDAEELYQEQLDRWMQIAALNDTKGHEEHIASLFGTFITS